MQIIALEICLNMCIESSTVPELWNTYAATNSDNEKNSVRKNLMSSDNREDIMTVHIVLFFHIRNRTE